MISDTFDKQCNFYSDLIIRQKYQLLNQMTERIIYPQTTINSKHKQQSQTPSIKLSENSINDDIKGDYIPPKTDQQFFGNLSFYTPICYNGSGTPIFMSNNRWYSNLPLMISVNAIGILVIIIVISNSSPLQKTGLKTLDQLTKYVIVNTITLIAINLFYLLTQFMNPGIVNITTITEQQYEKEKGKYFCIRCNGYRTGQMKHCPSCNVCIRKLNHHCGFFNKCIGQYQIFPFYGFLLAMMLGFISLAATIIWSLSRIKQWK